MSKPKNAEEHKAMVKDQPHEDPENLAFWEDVINDPLLLEGNNELDPDEFMMELEMMGKSG